MAKTASKQAPKAQAHISADYKGAGKGQRHGSTQHEDFAKESSARAKRIQEAKSLGAKFNDS